MAQTLPLGSFLDALALRLAAMSEDELRAVVMALGRSVAPRDRHAFLDRLGTTAPGPIGATDRFWADVEVLEEEAAMTGEPGWDDADDWDDHYDNGWDDECLEPGWAPRLVDLLARTGDCFEGDLSSALRAYQRLFAVAAAATELGWSLWSGDDGDRCREAGARYLRACWDVSAPAERPDRLRKCLIEVSAVLAPGDLSLAEVAGAAPGAPVDREQFVAGWVTALEPLADPPRSGEWAHRLLLEGVAALEGAPGLARVARRNGPRAGAAWLAAVDTARHDGDLKAAAALAAEALGSLALGPDRAGVAERLATLDANAGDDLGALDAWKEAWRSTRSLDRLLLVVSAAREVDAAADTIAWLDQQARGSSDAASAAVMVLAGRFDAALKITRRHQQQTATPGWLTGGDPRLVVVPVALAAGSGAVHDDRFPDTVLAALLDRIDAAAAFGPLDRVFDDDAPPTPDHGLTLAGLLVEHLRGLQLDARTRKTRLATGAQAAADAVAAIVEAKNRPRYADAAAYAIAHAEAVALTEGGAAGNTTADAAYARYPRHSAYRAELEQARRRSPLLSDPPSRYRR